MAKRGRPLGRTSWARTSANIAAHHAQSLMDMWLAGVPVEAIRRLLFPLLDRVEIPTMIDACWSKQPTRRRYTVPKGIKEAICRMAIEYAEALHLGQERALRSERLRNWKRIVEAIQETAKTIGRPMDFLLVEDHAITQRWRKPNLEQVLQIVNRRAPAITLRRKARFRRRTN